MLYIKSNDSYALDYIHVVDDDLGIRSVTLDGVEVGNICHQACVSEGWVTVTDEEPVVIGDEIRRYRKTGVVTVIQSETGYIWSLDSEK